jgi:hypothetical protein
MLRNIGLDVHRNSVVMAIADGWSESDVRLEAGGVKDAQKAIVLSSWDARSD